MINRTTEEMRAIHDKKTEKWNNKEVRDMFYNKSPVEEIPIWIDLGSSSHHPEREGGISTCDLVLWCKFADNQWFRPYGGFNGSQIHQMIEICDNDNQVERLIEMLMSKPG